VFQEFTKTATIPARPDDIWAALLDFHRVASWLSIVGQVREVDPTARYTAVLEDRVGPFALRADLTVTVTADTAQRRLHVAAAGEDRQVASRIGAALDVTVRDAPDGSILTATGRYEITGRIATLGAPAIRKKGDKVLDEFFANASRDLATYRGAEGEASGRSGAGGA
jgi:carbon monoxide dehydrogenase subunit G